MFELLTPWERATGIHAAKDLIILDCSQQLSFIVNFGLFNPSISAIQFVKNFCLQKSMAKD